MFSATVCGRCVPKQRSFSQSDLDLFCQLMKPPVIFRSLTPALARYSSEVDARQLSSSCLEDTGH
jgi:hypothetical protein